MTKVFYEVGVQIKERQTSGQNSFKESQEREDELVQQTSELLAATRMDEGMKKVDLQDCFDPWVRRKSVSGTKSVGEEELKQCIDRHRTSWEPTARRAEIVPEIIGSNLKQHQGSERGGGLGELIHHGKVQAEMPRCWKERT